MQFNYTPHNKLPIIVALASLFLMASCGTYQSASYDDDDGIYNSKSEPVEEDVTVATNTNNDGEYYKNYFAETSNEAGAIIDDSEVFTDVDDYRTDTAAIETTTGNAGWGDANEEVNITIIDTGFNAGWGWGWNNPWAWNAGWGWGWNNWGWGWNRPWAWNAGWGWGWNNWGWGWNAGWGWNNWGWGRPWYGYGYHPYGYARGYAYNYGRRGGNIYGRNALSGRSAAVARLADTRYNAVTRRGQSRLNRNALSRTRNGNTLSTRSRSTRAVRNGSSTRVRTNTNNSRIRNNSTRVRTNNSSRNIRNNNSSRRIRNNNSSSRTRVNRPNTSTRRNSSMRSRPSSSRSSGGRSIRSGGSMRSSGGFRGGGGRRGGRG